MIHVIDKMDTSKTTLQSVNLNRTGKSASRSRSPQPSQSQMLPNGIENNLPESNLVPNDRTEKLSLDNCNLSVVEPEVGTQTLSDRNNDVNEEAAVLFDESDITPPSPLLSNAFPPPPLLPSNSVFLSSPKPQVSYNLPYKYNEIKLKQEVS